MRFLSIYGMLRSAFNRQASDGTEYFRTLAEGRSCARLAPNFYWCDQSSTRSVTAAVRGIYKQADDLREIEGDSHVAIVKIPC